MMDDWKETHDRWEYVDIAAMLGKTFDRVYQESTDQLIFENATDRFTFYHSHDCCESVDIEDINGELGDLTGSPLLQAEENSESGEGEYNADYSEKTRKGFWPDGLPEPEYVDDSYTWTFYKFATIKGSVTVRWYGSSNGYYSETVQIKHETAA